MLYEVITRITRKIDESTADFEGKSAKTDFHYNGFQTPFNPGQDVCPKLSKKAAENLFKGQSVMVYGVDDAAIFKRTGIFMVRNNFV